MMHLQPPPQHASATPMPAAVGRVRAVLTGCARPTTRPGSLSAIDKQPRVGAVRAGPEGLEGDEQGDRRVHGGPDKALHVYPFAHLAAWRHELPQAADLLRAEGAFGENLAIDGPTEAEVCLADRWRIGGARFEVSQGRQPCWKLDDRFGVDGMARLVQASGRTGWYLRVLEPGPVAAGDAIVLEARPHPDWPLARLMQAIDRGERDPATLRAILGLPLPASWRKLFGQRLASGRVESWARRLTGRD